MSVQFILGRSGSGKTRYCIDSIIDFLLDPENQATGILLVPEQATYQAERAILSNPEIEGYNRLCVLSFDRLQFMINDNLAAHDLSHSGRKMIVHKLLLLNHDKLKVFNNTTRFGGLADHMSRIISELHEYDKTGRDIQDLLDKLQKRGSIISHRKFSDIATIFNAYRDYMNCRDNPFANNDYSLTSAAEKITRTDWLSGCRLWVDGFSGFTGQEFDCLGQLLKVSSSSQIALCLDPDLVDTDNITIENLEPSSMFCESERTYCMLADMIKKLKLKTENPVILKKIMRFKKCPDLEHVEKSIFTSAAKPVDSSGGITIAPCLDSRNEAEYIARKIHELINSQNYRYREISIIASDLETQLHYIQAAFSDMNIPCFIDRPESLEHNPVIEFIVSMLKIVSEGFRSPDIFAYLKTGLADIEMQEIDLLENYCLQFGIDRGKWLSDNWNYKDRNTHVYDNLQINGIRRRITANLEDLHTALFDKEKPKKISGREFCSIIWNAFDKSDLHKKLFQANENTLEETRQVYDKLVTLLDEYVLIFGDDTMDSSSHIAIFTRCLSQLRLKQIPPMLDQVLVGSIERSRHPELKAVFLMGATQKLFPASVEYDCILTEEDRLLAREEDFELADPLSRKLMSRQYLAYIAFTRPSEKLFITYPQVDDKNSEVMPSSFVSQLTDLFNNNIICRTGNQPASIGSSVGLIDLEGNLSAILGHNCKDPDLKYYPDLLSSENDQTLAVIGRRIKYSLSYDNNPKLDKKTTEQIYDKGIFCSASKLGSFAQCPYRYFAQYNLGLKKRRLFGLEPLDMGLFYHEIMENLFRELADKNRTVADLQNDEICRYIDLAARDLTQNNDQIRQFISAGGQNEFIIIQAKEKLTEAVKQFAEMSAAGVFRQTASEIKFSGDNCLVFKLDDGRKVFVSGIIDRIDTAVIDGRKVGLVFDYKKSKKNFSWTNAYHGLDLQLMIYFLALNQFKDKSIMCDDIAGAFFVHIEESPADLNDKKEAFARKACGFFNSRYAEYLDSSFNSGWNRYYGFYLKNDGTQGHYGKGTAVKPKHFGNMLRNAEDTILKLAQNITHGTIIPMPFRLGKTCPCSHCDYRAVCRFDWQINKYNAIESVSKIDYLEAGGCR